MKNLIITLICILLSGCSSVLYEKMEKLSNLNQISYINTTNKKIIKTFEKKIYGNNNFIIVLGHVCNDYITYCSYKGIIYSKSNKTKYYFKETKPKQIEIVTAYDESYFTLKNILDLFISNDYEILKNYVGVEFNHMESAYYVYDINNNSENDNLFIYRNLFMDDKGFLRP